MEQQQAVNRLYWRNDNGDWELVLESDNDKEIQEKAGLLVQVASRGIVGYAKYPAAPDYMRWTVYSRETAQSRRGCVWEKDLPPSIKLLEMLTCN